MILDWNAFAVAFFLITGWCFWRHRLDTLLPLWLRFQVRTPAGGILLFVGLLGLARLGLQGLPPLPAGVGFGLALGSVLALVRREEERAPLPLLGDRVEA